MKQTGVTGEIVTISGQTQAFSRAHAREIVEAHGGKLVGTPTQDTTLMVIAAGVSARKIEHARLLGVRMIDEAEFLAMIGLGE